MVLSADVWIQIFSWTIIVTLAFVIPGTIAALVRRFLRNENRYVRKTFRHFSRIISLSALPFSVIFLLIVGFEGVFLYLSVSWVLILIGGILYLPDALEPLEDMATVVIDRVLSAYYKYTARRPAR